ncbi:MAG: PQQ-binding-like beta-propeller repeat protein, partial [bacterium]
MKNQAKEEEKLLLAEKKEYKFIRIYRGIVFSGLLILIQLGNNGVFAAGDSWPMFQHDPQRSARSNATQIHQPVLKWNYYVNKYIFVPPVIDQQGKIYLVTEAGDLHIVSSSGKKEKIISIGVEIDSTPAISKQGNIYVGVSDGHILCFNSNYETQWVYPTHSKIKTSAIAVSDDETIFIGTVDGKLYAINKDGSLRWKYDTESIIQSSPAISQDGIIYIGTNDGNLHAIAPDGTFIFKKDVKKSIFSSPTIDSAGNVYIGSSDKTLSIISKDGSMNSIPLNSTVYSSPVVSKDGSIYIGTEEGLYGITPKGVWTTKIGRIFNCTPVITSNGTIYIATFDGNIYAIEPEKGEILWSYKIGLGPTSLAIDQEGTIYVGSRDRNLYAITSQITPIAQKPKIPTPQAKEEVVVKEVKIIPPVSPTNLIATSVSQSEIRITWQDNADNEIGYRVYRKLEDEPKWTLIKELPANSTSFLDPDLQAETTYFYRVVAYNKMGFSQYSVESSTTTKPLLPTPTPQPLTEVEVTPAPVQPVPPSQPPVEIKIPPILIQPEPLPPQIPPVVPAPVVVVPTPPIIPKPTVTPEPLPPQIPPVVPAPVVVVPTPPII